MTTNKKSILRKLEPHFLIYLEAEFGIKGTRACKFLTTAQILLEENNASIPCIGELVTYSLREAMTSLRDASEEFLILPHTEKGLELKQLMDDVASARHKYEKTPCDLQQNKEKALNDRFRSIDDLENFRKMPRKMQQKSKYAEKFQNIIAAQTSYLPPEETPAIKYYFEVLADLNELTHTQASLQEARAKWSECLKAIESFSMMPTIRRDKLESLAKIETPAENDIKQLRQYAVTSTHYRHFFEHLSSMNWLRVLWETDIIDPPKYEPESPGEFWAVAFALEKFYEEFPTEIVELLETIFERHKNAPEAIFHIALCAYQIGAEALPIVSMAVSKFPASPEITQLGYQASEKADSSSDLMTSLFNQLVQPTQLNFHVYLMSLYSIKKLMEAFAEGITKYNYTQRIELICYKLKAIPENNLTRQKLEHIQGGSINQCRDDDSDLFSILLNGLLMILEKSQSWAPAETIIESLSKLPPFLRQRVRAWLLATSNNVQSKTLIQEISEAIEFNEVTGDYLNLLDRIAEVSKSSEIDTVWIEALADGPNEEIIKKAIVENFIPEEWRRKIEWLNILIDNSNQKWKFSDKFEQNWKLAIQELSGLHLFHDRKSLEFAYKTEFFHGSSPISAEELQKLDPEKAASLVAAWRPKDPPQSNQELFQTSYELGGALRSTVQANPSKWLKSPHTILETLRDPTYIHPYLDGIESAFKDGNSQPSDQQISELIDFIEMIYHKSRDVEPLEKNQSGDDINWHEVKRSSIRLINTLASSEIGYGNCRDKVWTILKTQIQDRSEPTAISTDTEVDTHFNALNRACTYALQSLLSFSVYEYNKFKTVRAETLQVLEDCLRLSGQDGAEFRAIIAPHLNLLEYLAEEWLKSESTRDLMLGEHAPDDLAQKTVDQTFKFWQPSDWLLKNYREMIKVSVKKHVDKSLVHYLIGMLRKHEGYSVEEVVNFLSGVPEQTDRDANPYAPWHKKTTAISCAGEQLGRLLRIENGPETSTLLKIADCFWETVLKRKQPEHLGGFGWYSELSDMDDTLWTKRTLETLRLTRGHIEWQHKVEERALQLDDKKDCLDILNHLVRARNPFYRITKTKDYALQALEAAQELSGSPEYKRLETALLERGLEIPPKQETSDTD